MKPEIRNPKSQCGAQRQGRRTSGLQPPASSRRGFTLTELLVVIGIIALLASLTTVAVLPMLEGRSLSSGARIVHALAYQARTYAATQGNMACLWFDGDTGQIGILRWEQAYWDTWPNFVGETDAQAFTNAWRRLEQPEYLPKGVKFADADPTTTAIEPVRPLLDIDDDGDNATNGTNEDPYNGSDDDGDGKTDEDPTAYYLVVFGTDGGVRSDRLGPVAPSFWPPNLTNWEVCLQDPTGANKKVLEFTFASGLVRIRDE